MYLYIEDETDAKGVHAVISVLMDHPCTDFEGDRFCNFLAERLQEWELGRYGQPDVTPGQQLNEMMLSNSLEPNSPEMTEIFGSGRQVWLAVNDQFEFTEEQVNALARHFNVSPSLFINEKERVTG